MSAVAYNCDNISSTVTCMTYCTYRYYSWYEDPVPAPPVVISLNGGTYTQPQIITLTSSENVIIYYTLDGSSVYSQEHNPSPSALLYTTPITITSSCVLKTDGWIIYPNGSSIKSYEST